MVIKKKISDTTYIEFTAEELGDTVVCDDCCRDFTEDKTIGGIYFAGRAIGPCCAEKWLKSIKEHNEEQFIRGVCPQDMSFAEWVRKKLR